MTQHIVAIDDDPLCLQFVKIALEAHDYTVHGFDDAKTALQYIKSSTYTTNLIISDIAMPNMSGLELLSTINNNSRWKRIPVVFETAMCADNVEQFIGLGASDFIIKPYTMQNLLNVVNRILIQHDSQTRKASHTQLLSA